MLHIVPIICLIIFTWFIEFRLKKEVMDIHNEVNKLKEYINLNKKNIEINKNSISKLYDND